MSEPLRTDTPPAREAPSPADHGAHIERLLLSGLDLYFAGQYQDAINVWTRVVFLERGHGRARAYIERARSAISEQQRQAEELLHKGQAAYAAGALDEARHWLTQAVERGGSSDEALVLLQQINRFSVSTPQTRGVEASDSREPDVASPSRSTSPSAGRGWWVGMGSLALVSALALGAAPLVSWVGARRSAEAPVQSALRPEPLPVASPSEVALTRARQLYAGGHLADALRDLDRIDVGDARWAEAERLRGDIQRDLLATARLGPSAGRPR